MSRKIDLIGQVFGFLKVLAEATNPLGGEARWVCLCLACGNPAHIVKGTLLRDGRSRSCGCLLGGAEDLMGQVFGRLTVLSRVEAPLTRSGGAQKTRAAWWLCRCSCEAATEKVISSQALKSGNTTSCGCVQRERASESHKGHDPYETDPAKRSEYATAAHLVPRKYGSNAPRPRHKFHDTLHNKDWLTEHYITQWKSKAEMGRIADCSSVSVQKALDRYGILREEDTPPDLRPKGGVGGRPRLTGDAVTKQVMYGRSRRKTAPGPCVVCNTTGKHINHKDRNPWNDDASNMERVCVKCHNRQHSLEEAVMIEWLRERFGVSFMEVYAEARSRLLAAR